ncbi:uncharacterized protein LOC131158248 [Malania oleifera]|uniref:uncharacterized protein LOC131158248 n=1 Tax=Malania oleifera TaxID=397392 RepID=UPI0025ADCD61|nr:uncharacterized protein LOC131158248 [Malania oleifera]
MDSGRGAPRPLRVLGTTAAVFFGGMFTLSLASSFTIRTVKAVAEAKRKKVALPCGVCRGKGFYICKLCKGASTIEWSPLFDPLVINPCLCPTCDGNRYLWKLIADRGSWTPQGSIFANLFVNYWVQRCLNCLGKGYS